MGPREDISSAAVAALQKTGYLELVSDWPLQNPFPPRRAESSLLHIEDTQPVWHATVIEGGEAGGQGTTDYIIPRPFRGMLPTFDGVWQKLTMKRYAGRAMRREGGWLPRKNHVRPKGWWWPPRRLYRDHLVPQSV